jgi:ribosomal protein S18 acetylase RimI-like enzyme
LNTGRLVVSDNHHTLSVRPLESSDCEEVARIHKNAFIGFFLTELGAGFLKHYYTGIVELQQIGLVIGEENKIGGFVVGIDNNSRFYKNLFRTFWPRFISSLAFEIIRRPSLLISITERLRVKFRDKNAEEPRSITLTSIAVEPSGRISGAGRILLHSFLRVCKRRGYNVVVLETDAEKNEAVRSFYERNGFTDEGTYKAMNDRVMAQYRMDMSMYDPENQI